MRLLDAIVHNAGVYAGQAGRRGEEGVPTLFGVNVLAPYYFDLWGCCAAAGETCLCFVWVASRWRVRWWGYRCWWLWEYEASGRHVCKGCGEAVDWLSE